MALTSEQIEIVKNTPVTDRRYWQALREHAKPEWPEIHPKPEHTSRDAWPEEGFEVPDPVQDLLDLLRSEGFEAHVTYSRGFHRSTRINTYKRVHVLVVRFKGFGHCGYAAYETPTEKRAWEWTSIGILRIGSFPHYGALRTDLTEWISVRGEVGERWYRDITIREAQKKERQREAQRNRSKSAKREGAS